MKKNTKVVLGSSIVMLSILALLIIATPASSGKEVTIEYIHEHASELKDKYITTEGTLVDDSIEWNADDIELRFALEGDDGAVLPIVYHGVEPDNFTDEVIIIVQGYLQDDGIFEAEKVQTRCPSTYEGIDPDEYDPEIHRQMKHEQ